MAMASRSSVRAFLAEQGGRRFGEAARLRLRVDLRKTVEAGRNLDGRVCSDAAKGIAAAVREGGDKGYLLSEGEKVSPLSTEEGLTGGKDMPGRKTETRLIVPWGCGGAGGRGRSKRGGDAGGPSWGAELL